MSSERGAIAWMANNPVAANLLMLTIMIGGLAAIGGIGVDVVVVLQPRIAVQAGMHPGQVIAFAVVFQNQFPVRLDVERKPG